MSVEFQKPLVLLEWQAGHQRHSRCARASRLDDVDSANKGNKKKLHWKDCR